MKVLVIADIHGNAEALRAVLERERDADTTVFLGDTVSPGPQPNETVALLDHLPGTFIAGNHDLEVLEPSRLEGWPAQWRAYSQWVLDTLEPAGYGFLRTLKAGGEYAEGGVQMFLGHGEFDDRPRNALPDTPDDRLVTIADGSESPFVLFGHSHVQFRRMINDQEFINPGSVGQNRCGRLLACYGVFEDGLFEHRQVEYDPSPWLEALARIEPLDEFPEFRDWLKRGLLTGYGIGETEPWTRFAQQGYY
jgi:protein phosphatase